MPKPKEQIDQRKLVLASFINYCALHPEERFWQALRNWSGHDFIVATNFAPYDFGKENAWMKDTFSWEGRNG